MKKCDHCRRVAKLTPKGEFDLCEKCLEIPVERMEAKKVERQGQRAMFD